MFPGVASIAPNSDSPAAHLRILADRIDAGEIKNIDSLLMFMLDEYVAGDFKMGLYVCGRPITRLQFIGLMQRVVVEESLRGMV